MKKFPLFYPAVPLIWRLLWYVLFYSGIGKGEILGLRWLDLELKHGIIHVGETKDDSSTKTDERKDIPIVLLLREEFLQSAKNKKGEDVFQGISNFKTTRHADLRRAGIKNFRFHDPQHTFTSHLVMNGETLVIVKSFSVTNR